MKRGIVATLALGGLVAALACTRDGGGAGGLDEERPLVVATTTMLTDLAATLGGEAVRVEGIMQPGGDPHLYQPTPADARRLARSALVVTSGLGLEGWIDDLVRNAGGTRPVVVASRGIEPIRMAGTTQGVDPHFWFDLQLWRRAARTVGEALAELVAHDPEAAAGVRARLADYEAQLEALDAWVRASLASIPEGQRVLVTSHDAFNYFGRAYGVEVVGIQGISTESDASQRDVINVIEIVRRRRAPAVFVETSVNPALVRRVAAETGARLAGPLYSDSIGAEDSPAGTFVGTVAENVRLITEALGGKHVPFAHEPVAAQEVVR